jgi:aryl-alcohol dehydrogenase-like predicted oxidoreductase
MSILGSIPTVELGNSGEKVSRIALGCMMMGTQTGDEESFALLDRYAADGGAFLDTADCYSWWAAKGTAGGQSEELLGRWFARSGRRDATFLATKGTATITDLEAVWPADAPEANWDAVWKNIAGASSEVLRSSLEGSLRRLGTDYIDLYYVHVDDRTTPLEETLETLASFVAEGKVRHIGWSNVRTWRLEAIRLLCESNGWPAPVALQQQHSYLQRKPGLRHASIVGDEQLEYLAEHPALSLVAYSPLLKGLYDQTPQERAGNWALGPYAGESADRRLATLEAVADEIGAKPGQVVLAWLLAQSDPRVIPLIGTTKVSRYLEAAGALELQLTAEQLARLDAA